MRTKRIAFTLLAAAGLAACGGDPLKEAFRDPSNEFRPQPFWHLNGALTSEHIDRQLTEARDKAGFGGVAVLPVTAQPHWQKGFMCPGMSPEYLGQEYFDRYTDILEVSKRNGTQVILYDDIDFPSGSAGGRLLREYPQYTRKFLAKHEFTARGGTRFRQEFRPDTTATVMAVSALNPQTKEVVDLGGDYRDGVLEWQVPPGEWKVMLFTCNYSVGGVHGHLVDYMQPEAVETLLEMTYGEYDKRYRPYFGNVIRKTFFDDVGFVHMEQTWTPAITEIFRERYGRNPALYYPALFYDIGPETGAARIAFYDIRSELMAEGYVRQVSEWSEVRRMRSMGHPPENYSPNSVVAHGDILKYYRHVDIPLLDAILYFRRGLNGFKQVCSAADLGDKPVVGAELCGAYPEEMDSAMLYRTTLEAMVRGVNFVVPHGMWYDTDPQTVRIPPLIAPENPLLGPALKDYSASTGRSCMLLQGGRRISDIAVLWPISAIQAESYMFRDAESGLPIANWHPDDVVNYALSGMLTNELHRDFTYVHPENLAEGKVSVEGDRLRLNNAENMQEYSVLIIPGGGYISADALKRIGEFYENGGKVIALASLPSHAAEFGRDAEVQSLIASVFGTPTPIAEATATNDRGGKFIFMPQATVQSVADALEQTECEADLVIPDARPDEAGFINYTHKQRDGRDFYFVTNTRESPFEGEISLRGEFRAVEVWNPHTGETAPAEFRIEKGRTLVPVRIPIVRSLFIVTRK